MREETETPASAQNPLALPARGALEVVAEPIGGTGRAARRKRGLRWWCGFIPGVPTLVALGFYLNDDDAPTMKRMMVLLAFIYLLSPIDFIPEAFFGVFGLVDDVGVFLMLVKFIGSQQLKPYKQRARAWFRGEWD